MRPEQHSQRQVSRRTSERGFTLIELMIVVVIIGILAAIAIPKFGLLGTKTREKEAEVLLRQIYTLQEAYFAREGYYAGVVNDLSVVGWIPPTALKNYGQPIVSNGGGPGSTSYRACMAAASADLSDMTIDQTGDFGSTC